MSTINHGPESRVRGAKNLPRNQLRIATLNVRTLTQAGSLEALKMDLARYKLDILGVQETRLQEQEIDLGDHKLYLSDSWLSGVKSRQGGVGVAVKKSLINSIVEQVALSERICYVKFAAQRRANLAVVVCYAPTNEASLQEKDLFWSQLSDLVSSFKHRERICVIGDLNAEPGHQLNDTMSCRGPFGMGEENENSEKLLSFCTSHKLLVGGTWFQHRQVHRYTFNPPDPSCRKKMLDHILFAERYRGCLTNVRSRRGKTTITDHELVIAEVSMKLLSKKSCFTPRISSAKLQDETTRDLFTQEVKLHLDKSGDFENTEQSWDNFRKALNQAAVKCLLPDKRVNKPWISPDSLELIRKRADLQLKKHSSAEVLLEFTNCCKEVRKALRADKRAWLERKGQEVQSFADRGNLKEVFGASQQICRNWRPQLTKLVSSTGVNLRTKEERLERWTEHFSQLLNPSTFSCSTRLDPEEAAESLPIDLSPIRFEEVLLSVHLKCNLYKALVLSAVLYSSETWTLSKLMERKLESFHCGCLRRILRVSYLEKATNDEIMSRSRMPQLSTMIMLKRIKWYGHIQRMEPGRLARSAFDWDPPDQYAHARRAPGGQRKTWMSQIEGDCVRNKVSFTRLQEKAATGSKNAFNNFVVQHFTE